MVSAEFRVLAMTDVMGGLPENAPPSLWRPFSGHPRHSQSQSGSSSTWLPAKTRTQSTAWRAREFSRRAHAFSCHSWDRDDEEAA